MAKAFVGIAVAAMLTGCKDDFLDADPQTIFSPEQTFKTEAGLRSAIARCDRSYKDILLSAKR